jgi:hypothetical protein
MAPRSVASLASDLAMISTTGVPRKKMGGPLERARALFVAMRHAQHRLLLLYCAQRQPADVNFVCLRLVRCYLLYSQCTTHHPAT